MPASAKSFLLSFLQLQNFFLWLWCLMTGLCGHLKTPSLHDHHEQQSLQEPHSLLLGIWLLDYPSTLGLSVHLEFSVTLLLTIFSVMLLQYWRMHVPTWFIEQLVIFCAVLTFIVTLVCIVLSYIYIIRTVLRLPSAQERKKAFSTCSSHMIVVFITYGSCIFMYVKPSAKDEVALN